MLSNISQNTNKFGALNSNLSKTQSLTSKFKNLSKNQAYYAKKGEPIYQKDMDFDEDGIVTFDEFQKYCKESRADTEQLLKNWLIYHASKDVEEQSKAKNKSDTAENGETIYAKKGDSKYEAVMDSNDDGKITYKEYLEYCKDNAKEDKKPADSTEKAIEEYTKTEAPEGKIETEA